MELFLVLLSALAPVAVDGVLSSMNIDETLATIGLFAFLYFFNKLRKRGKERIKSLMNQ